MIYTWRHKSTTPCHYPIPVVIPRLDRGIQPVKLDCPVKPDNDKQPNTSVVLYNMLWR